MFPYLAKLFWFLFSPLSLVIGLLLIGLLVGLTRHRRMSRWLIGLATALLVLSSTTNLGLLLVRPLEARFERPPEPPEVTGIIVLGGGMNSSLNGLNGGWELNRAGDRFAEALRLALRHPEARVLVTGGITVLSDAPETEADAASRFFGDFGIAPDRLLAEGKARNTEENAQLSKILAAPRPGETWLLVTSAAHMPRSVGLFRAAGFEVVPWPTDYFTATDVWPALALGSGTENLDILNAALREWAGLTAYYFTGRIDDWLPGPTR
jgi:uncharacterized SAM-binding protein YcdF (DUF218 family)